MKYAPALCAANRGNLMAKRAAARSRIWAMPGGTPSESRFGTMAVDNPIHRMLDEIGLPWRLLGAELEARYGMSKSLFGQDVLSIATRPPLLGGLLRPLEAEDGDFAPDLPALRFGSHASHGRDAGFNIRMAAADLSPALGAAEVHRRYNTLVCEWSHQRASVGLTAWPPEWQDPSFKLVHEPDARLIAACTVTIDTGFRPAPTDEELRWTESFGEAGKIRCRWPNPSRERSLEFSRDVVPDASLRGCIG